jgi:hypothetical protein
MSSSLFITKTIVEWRETNLKERGFELKDTVSATTPENAISFHLKEKIF